VIWLLLACTAPVDSASDTGCGPNVPTWTGWTQGFVTGQCQSCHATTSPDRHGAPAAFTFDTLDQALDHADAVRASVLTDRTMPPAGGVSDDELVLLERWLDCPL
jgi:uncharacterized membrane protein